MGASVSQTETGWSDTVQVWESGVARLEDQELAHMRSQTSGWWMGGGGQIQGQHNIFPSLVKEHDGALAALVNFVLFSCPGTQ